MRSSRATLPVIASIAVAMVCGGLAGVGVHWAAALRQDRLSQVSATILEPAAWDGSRPATGRWTAPDGTSRTGTIPAAPGRPAGTQFPVWVGQAGQITAAPEALFYRVAHPLLAGAAVAGGIILIAHYVLRYPDPVDIEWGQVSDTWRRDYLLTSEW